MSDNNEINNESNTSHIKVIEPEEDENDNITRGLGTFLTGVEIDVDQWRADVVEELQSWLKNIQSKKTALGDPLVEFPEGWDKKFDLNQKQQLDVIASGLVKNLQGSEAKEVQAEIQSIRAQAEKLRALEKQIVQMGSDSDDELFNRLTKEEEDILDTEINIPNIDLSGPNPFELSESVKKRLSEIDAKLGFDDDGEELTKSLKEVNEELLQIYMRELKDVESLENNTEKLVDDSNQNQSVTANSSEEDSSTQLNSPNVSSKPNSRGKVIPPLQRVEAPVTSGSSKHMKV